MTRTYAVRSTPSSVGLIAGCPSRHGWRRWPLWACCVRMARGPATTSIASASTAGRTVALRVSCPRSGSTAVTVPTTRPAAYGVSSMLPRVRTTSPTTGVEGTALESRSEPRGRDSESPGADGDTVPSVPAGPTRTATTEPELPSTWTSLVHGDTATTRPTRPSAATTVESARIPSRDPTSMVTLRPPSGLRSVATTRAGTRVRPFVTPEPSSSSRRPRSSRRCCCSAMTARSLVFSPSTAVSSSRGAPARARWTGPSTRPPARRTPSAIPDPARSERRRARVSGARTASSGRRRVGCMRLEAVVPDEDALEAVEVVDAAAGPAGHGAQRVVGDLHGHPSSWRIRRRGRAGALRLRSG